MVSRTWSMDMANVVFIPEIEDVFYIYKLGDRSRKCHVVAIVDSNQVVYKWYGKHKQWWHYEVEDIETINHHKSIYINMKESKCYEL